MDVEVVEIHRVRDTRGILVDFLKRDELSDELKLFGQMYYVTFESKGALRGNHFHETKYEWFVVVQGKIQVELEDVNSREKMKMTLEESQDKTTRLRIGPYIAHTFMSLTDRAMMMNYASKPYHSTAPDTHKYPLS